MNRSDYLLHSNSEISQLLKEEGFHEYALGVMNVLEQMKPGSVIRLEAPEDRLRWLIKSVCIFILESNHWREYDMNKDYTKVRRIDIPEKWRHDDVPVPDKMVL